MIGQYRTASAAREIVATYDKATVAVKEEVARLLNENLLTDTVIASLATKSSILLFLIPPNISPWSNDAAVMSSRLTRTQVNQ